MDFKKKLNDLLLAESDATYLGRSDYGQAVAVKARKRRDTHYNELVAYVEALEIDGARGPRLVAQEHALAQALNAAISNMHDPANVKRLRQAVWEVAPDTVVSLCIGAFLASFDAAQKAARDVLSRDDR